MGSSITFAFREPEVVLGLPWLLARYMFDLDLSKYRQRPPYCQLWTTEHGVLHRSKYISASWICFHFALPSRPSARERRLVRGLLRNDHTVFTLVTLSGYLSGRILMRSMPQGMPHDNDVWAETRWLLGPFCTGRYGCTCTCTVDWCDVTCLRSSHRSGIVGAARYPGHSGDVSVPRVCSRPPAYHLRRQFALARRTPIPTLNQVGFATCSLQCLRLRTPTPSRTRAVRLVVDSLLSSVGLDCSLSVSECSDTSLTSSP